MSRVFVSSTCYDLIDLRGEIKRILVEADLKPVMSDDVEFFDIAGQRDSIEICLENVRSSDAFVCILSQRYGPSLAKAGYPDVSATHLEYREAKVRGLPLHVFVRDRLEAEYSLSKKHRAVHGSLDGFETRWVQKGQFGIFGLLDEHQTLVKGSPSTNWYTVFSTSVDLAERVQRQLATIASRATISSLLAQGTLPIFSCKASYWRDRSQAGVLVGILGRHPALDVSVCVTVDGRFDSVYIGDLTDEEPHPVALSSAVESMPRSFTILFSTHAGYRVSQDFVLDGNAYKRSAIRLRDRGGFQVA